MTIIIAIVTPNLTSSCGYSGLLEVPVVVDSLVGHRVCTVILVVILSCKVMVLIIRWYSLNW